MKALKEIKRVQIHNPRMNGDVVFCLFYPATSSNTGYIGKNGNDRRNQGEKHITIPTSLNAVLPFRNARVGLLVSHLRSVFPRKTEKAAGCNIINNMSKFYISPSRFRRHQN